MTQIDHCWGYPKDSKLTHYRNSCISVFTEAQLAIAKLWNQPRCLSVEAWTQNEVVYFFREMDATSNNPNKPIEPHIFVLKFQLKRIRLKRNGQRVQRENFPVKTSRELVDRLRNSPLNAARNCSENKSKAFLCTSLGMTWTEHWPQLSWWGLLIAGGNAKWSRHFGRRFDHILKINFVLSFCPVLFSVPAQRVDGVRLLRHLHTNVHSNSVQNVV